MEGNKSILLGTRGGSSVCLKFRERPEEWGVSDVVLEGRVRAPLLQSLLLQDGDSTDITEQEPDEDGGRHTQVLGAFHDGGGGEPETRPLQDLPEVVGMSAVAPESTLDELPLEVQENKI